MFGFNTDKVAQGEITSGGLNSRGKMAEWDFGDDIRAGVYSLFGKDYSRENLERLAREKQTQQYNESDAISALNTTLTQVRPGTTITRKAGESLADMQARGKLQVGLGNAIGEARITNPDADLTGVTNIQQLREIVGNDNQRQKDATTKKVENRENEERDRYWSERQSAHDLRVMQVQGQIVNEKSQLAQQERQNLREHKADMRSLDNQLAGYNMENARMMQQEENRRQDKKEKAMMALIASLSNLGASFSI